MAASDAAAASTWSCDICATTTPAPRQREGWLRLPPGWLALEETIDCVAVLVCSEGCADTYECHERERTDKERRRPAA